MSKQSDIEWLNNNPNLKQVSPLTWVWVDEPKTMSDKKERNTIITDWLEKHGDPEIDKKVEERLEQITREVMSEKKQSSVEWLIEQLKERGYAEDFSTHLLFEQAKTMHQQEIEETYDREVIGDIQNWYIRNGKHYYELHYNKTSTKQDNE